MTQERFVYKVGVVYCAMTHHDRTVRARIDVRIFSYWDAKNNIRWQTYYRHLGQPRPSKPPSIAMLPSVILSLENDHGAWFRRVTLVYNDTKCRLRLLGCL